MKYLFSFLFLILTTTCFSQYLNEPTDESTTIVAISENLEPIDVYRNAANLLMDEGYKIITRDADLFYLKTGFKKMKMGKNRIIISIRKKGLNTEAHIQGELGFGSMTQEIIKGQNKGKYWVLLEDIANDLGSDFKYK